MLCGGDYMNNIRDIEEIDEEEYVKSLENVLIFMCKTYDEIEKELVKLVEKENNKAFFKVPRVQGINHVVNISKIGKLKFEQPLYNFKDIFDIMQSKR